jgi:hypothetical protein
MFTAAPCFLNLVHRGCPASHRGPASPAAPPAHCSAPPPTPAATDKWNPPVIPFLSTVPEPNSSPSPRRPCARLPRLGPHAKAGPSAYLRSPPPPGCASRNPSRCLSTPARAAGTLASVATAVPRRHRLSAVEEPSRSCARR